MSLPPKEKKTRRPRKINNAIVDIRSINIPSGPNNINWLNTTKQHLKEREKKLLKIRITEVESVINRQEFGAKLVGACYKIPNELIEKVLFQNIFTSINKWTGIDGRRTKKQINTFRDYFQIGKNWWDINKQRIIASSFWIAVFDDLQKVFNDRMDHFKIIRQLFNGKVAFPNTRERLLINSSIIMNNTDIREYLLNLDSSLNIDKWIMTEQINQKSNNKTKKYAPIGKKILNKLYDTLDAIISTSTERSETPQTPQLQPLSELSININIEPPQSFPNNNNNNNTIYHGHGYGGNHGLSYHVSNLRHSPMNISALHIPNNFVINTPIILVNNNTPIILVQQIVSNDPHTLPQSHHIQIPPLAFTLPSFL